MILGLSRDDIEAHTHIPIHYVDFIENGEFDSFPSPAQARGMLTNYLNFLEFKPEEIMNRYAEALLIRLSERQTQQSPTTAKYPKPPPPAQNCQSAPMGTHVPIPGSDSDHLGWDHRCWSHHLGDWPGDARPI